MAKFVSMIRASGWAALIGLVALPAMLRAAEVPLASFTGIVHGISKKQVTIENADGNLIDFDINRKTKVLRGKTEIKPDEIMSGDEVIIEARQVMDQFLIAVIIHVQTPAKSSP